MTSRMFTRSELASLGVPPDSPDDVEYSETVLADEPVATLKYSQQRRCIFRADDDQTYAVTYEAQLDTGDYEVGPGPDDHGWWSDQVEGVRVQDRPVIVRRWEPVTDNPDAEQPPTGALDSLIALLEAAGTDPEAAREAAAAWVIEHGYEVASLHDDYRVDGEDW